MLMVGVVGCVLDKMATSTIDKVMLEISPVHSSPSAKVTVVGVGQVGMAITYGIMLEVQSYCGSA